MQPNKQDERLNNIIEVISSMAALDFSKKAEVHGTEELIDVIGIGLNMLSEALEDTVVSKQTLEEYAKNLERKNQELLEKEKRYIYSMSN